MKKQQFEITYKDGSTWRPPMGTWKDVAAFVAEWQCRRSADCLPDNRNITSVHIVPSCGECGRAD